MKSATSFPTLNCLKFEFRKLLGRRLPVIIFVCVVVSIFGSLWLENNGLEPSQSYALFAALLQRSMPLASFLVMIMATLCLNEEVAAGSLRAVLLRPVSKTNLLSAKLILNMSFAFFLGITVLGISWLTVEMTSEFSAIMIEISGLEPRVVFTNAAMQAICWKLGAAMLAPLLASAAFGTLISVLIESEGTAVAIGTFLFLAMQAAGPISQDLAPYLFPTYLELPIALLAELAGQDQSRQGIVDSWGPLSAGYTAPLGMALLFSIIGLLVFEKKDVAC
ncbi:MAG: hypothetical protein ACI97A_003089 [Planctomycetota bacterium]|jgi:hypothetical protein